MKIVYKIGIIFPELEATIIFIVFFNYLDPPPLLSTFLALSLHLAEIMKAREKLFLLSSE
jgi:hypothetical protein